MEHIIRAIVTKKCNVGFESVVIFDVYIEATGWLLNFMVKMALTVANFQSSGSKK